MDGMEVFDGGVEGRSIREVEVQTQFDNVREIDAGEGTIERIKADHRRKATRPTTPQLMQNNSVTKCPVDRGGSTECPVPVMGFAQTKNKTLLRKKNGDCATLLEIIPGGSHGTAGIVRTSSS